MATIEERTTANMEVVLEEVCRSLEHGGDHEIRKHIAQKLIYSLIQVANNIPCDLITTRDAQINLSGVLAKVPSWITYRWKTWVKLYALTLI